MNSRKVLQFHILLFALFALLPLSAEETQIMIRARAVDAKFIGSGVGGLEVVLENAASGEILDRGEITGGTGDTKTLMLTPTERGQQLSNDETAGYLSTINIDTPVQLRITLRGPLNVENSIQELSLTQWVVPGKDILGDGIVFNLPGLIVAAQADIATDTDMLKVQADVTLMCGCPLTDEGLWDARDYEVKALIPERKRKASRRFKTVEHKLEFTGEKNKFAGEIPKPKAGQVSVIVYAYNRNTGNTGVDVVVLP